MTIKEQTQNDSKTRAFVANGEWRIGYISRRIKSPGGWYF